MYLYFHCPLNICCNLSMYIHLFMSLLCILYVYTFCLFFVLQHKNIIFIIFQILFLDRDIQRSVWNRVHGGHCICGKTPSRQFQRQGGTGDWRPHYGKHEGVHNSRDHARGVSRLDLPTRAMQSVRLWWTCCEN